MTFLPNSLAENYFLNGEMWTWYFADSIGIYSTVFHRTLRYGLSLSGFVWRSISWLSQRPTLIHPSIDHRTHFTSKILSSPPPLSAMLEPFPLQSTAGLARPPASKSINLSPPQTPTRASARGLHSAPTGSCAAMSAWRSPLSRSNRLRRLRPSPTRRRRRQRRRPPQRRAGSRARREDPAVAWTSGRS